MLRMRKLPVFCLLVALISGLLLPRPVEANRGRLLPVITFPGQIVFVGADYNVWLIQGDSGARYRLTKDGSEKGINYFSPSFSPDGKRLIFQGRASGSAGLTIYLMESGSSEVRQIGTNWEISSSPWSPDGQKLVYTNARIMGKPVDQSVPQGVLVYDLATGQSTPVQQSSNGELFFDARWSPDGKMLSFRDYCFECVGQFTTLELDRGIRYDWSVKGTDYWVGLDADWSPDGSQVAYDQWDYYNGPDTTYSLWVGQADGQNMHSIFAAQGKSVAFPEWSPDGSKIAFSQVTISVVENVWQRRSDLVVVSPDGTNARTLYQGAREVFPKDWSPDGKMLLFSRDSGGYQGSILSIYDLEKGKSFEIGNDLAYAAASWSRTSGQEFQPAMEGESTQTTWTVKPPFPIDGNALLYQSKDGALVIFDNNSKGSIALTQTGSVESFTVSPSQKRIFVKGKDGQGYLMDIEPQPGGILSIHQQKMLAPPEGTSFYVTFSPSETFFTYTDTLKRIWIVNGAGEQEQLAYAIGAPSWSYDEQWMSLETLDHRLYISQSQGPFQLLAEGVNWGSAAWSPTHNWLAFALGNSDYSSFNMNQQDDRKVLLYNTENGQTSQVMDGVGTSGWSRDGRILAVSRMDSIGASAYSWTDFLVDPFTLRTQEVGSYYSRDANLHGWTRVNEPYIYGAFRAEKDLSSANRIAASLLAAGEDGHTFVGLDSLNESGMEEDIQVFCWNDQRGDRVNIANIRVGPLYGAVMPGIWAQLSPDNQWVTLIYFQNEDHHVKITRCDGQSQAEVLPDGAMKIGVLNYYQFSSNSRWLAGVTKEGDSSWFLRVHSLNETGVGPATNLPLSTWVPFFWLNPIIYPVENTATPVPSPAPKPTAASQESAGSKGLPINATAQPSAVSSPPAAPVKDRQYSGLVLIAAAGLLGLFIGGIFLALLIWFVVRRSNQGPAPHPAKRPSSEMDQAVSMIKKGQFREGYDCLHLVVTRNPRDGAAWYWMGVAARDSNQIRTAQRCFSRAAALGYQPAEKALKEITG